MNSLVKRNYFSIRFITYILISLIFTLLTFAIVSKVNAKTELSEQGQHLVTIHDRGVEKVVLTDAETIAEALAKAGIILDEKDTVEPAREEKLIASEYNVNIYRARPVTVIDGDVRQRIVTPYQTAEQIAKSAGIDLYPEDTATISRSDDILADGAGLVMTIDRATLVSLDLYGKTSQVRTQGQTVGDLLSGKAISLSENDRVSPDVSNPIEPNMNIKVWREGKQTITVSEVVPFTVSSINDADRAVGYKEIKTTGVNGSREVTYEIEIVNGVEVGRVEIASIVTSPATQQVEIVGVKQLGSYTTPSENETITWNYLLSQGFSKEQTAGIMGNLMQEHRFRTDGDGLAQWTGGRKAKLLALPDPYSIYTQLSYLMSELNGPYVSVKNDIKATNDIPTVVRIFQNRFEKCGICAENNRIQYAYNIYVSH